jgi:hypothetical protein
MIVDDRNLDLPEFVKYPKIPYVENYPDIYGSEGYIFEKIDGSLSQIRKINSGRVVGGSRANYLTGEKARKSRWMGDFLKWMHNNTSLYNIPENMVIYGEWLNPISVNYDKENENKFYFIDLAIAEDGKPKFYDYGEAINYLKSWNLDDIIFLDPIKKGFFDDYSIKSLIQDYEGKLGPEFEGLVLKNYNTEEFAKFLTPKYSEIRKQAKDIQDKYVTKTRIDKARRRIDDSGVEINLDNLASEIIQDIVAESGVSVDINAVKGVIRVKNLFP